MESASSHPYSPLKRKLSPLLEKSLSRKPESQHLISIYYSQKPDPYEDELSFHLFRKHADFHYPAIYFHPESSPVQPAFLERFDVRGFPLPDICFASKVAYSHFITSPKFYEILKTVAPAAEFYLIFQIDSFLIQTGLETFMKEPFDYYGAVWEKGLLPGGWCGPRDPAQEVIDPGLRASMKPLHVGNGGFSLRRIAPCFEVAKKYNIAQLSYMQEDAFYCNFGQLTGLRFAPEMLARRFAWEDAPSVKTYIQEMGIPQPLGIHNLPVEMAELLLRKAVGP